MLKRECDYDRCCLKNGNCEIPGSDGLPVQCVGPWVRGKHYILEKYLKATSAVRSKFTKKGNAVFIDLFSGPGRCIIREEYSEIDGGGIIALQLDKGRFNEYYYVDIENENTKALEKRIGERAGCNILTADSNMIVSSLTSNFMKHDYRYHFAYIDPFGVEALKFETIKEMAKLARMDLLINFPIGSIKRNIRSWLRNTDTPLDRFLGTPIWRDGIERVSLRLIYNKLITIFEQQLMTLGYPKEGLQLKSGGISVKNTRDVPLYVLLLASKHPLAQRIWDSAKKIGPDGQRSLF